MDANQCQLDITLNYDLTAGFLNLISNFVALMILLGRVEDRKSILGLYNVAYDLSNGRSEQSFPRLGQMIIDYENPLKKLSEDFSPINRVGTLEKICKFPILARSIRFDLASKNLFQ